MISFIVLLNQRNQHNVVSIMKKREKIMTAISITLMEITIAIVCLLFLGPAYNDIINADYNVNGGVLAWTEYNKEVTLAREFNGHPAGTKFTAYSMSFDEYIVSSNLESSTVISKTIPFDYVAEKEDLLSTTNAMQHRVDEYISVRKAYMTYVASGFVALGLIAPFISVYSRKRKNRKKQQEEEELIAIQDSE